MFDGQSETPEFVQFELAEGGFATFRVGGKYNSISDDGKTRDGRPVTAIDGRRGFVRRVVGRGAEVARLLKFGDSE